MKYTKILEGFKGAEGSKDNLEKKFNEIAEYFLTKGYFYVNETRKVYICDVEFYYHEEDETNPNRIKDYSMYHRNRRDKNNLKPDFFAVGQFNAHASGIDITFEDVKNKKYRAGMLIRGFKIDNIKPPKGEYDERSTYFYEALLNCELQQGQPFTIEWKEYEDGELSPFGERKITPKTRKNIVQYHESGEKEGTKIIDKDNGKTIKCDRPWRFHI